MLIPLPVPASVYGLVLMLAALITGVLKLGQVRETATAGVGLMESWSSLQPVWLPVILITIVTTVLVMVVTGKVTQAMIGKEKKDERVSH